MEKKVTQKPVSDIKIILNILYPILALGAFFLCLYYASHKLGNPGVEINTESTLDVENLPLIPDMIPQVSQEYDKIEEETTEPESREHSTSRHSGRFMGGLYNSGIKGEKKYAASNKRLFQVIRKHKNIHLRQVDLTIGSMNKGDCFILDAGKEIYVYFGKKAKRLEKMKTISAANQIKDQNHNGHAVVYICDELASQINREQFLEILGPISPSSVPDESTGEDNETFKTGDERATTLYQVFDAFGTLMMDTNDCFILEPVSGIYDGNGKKATGQKKKRAISRAKEFLQNKIYPTRTKVTRIVDGAETAHLKQYFSTWRDQGPQHSRLLRAANDNSDTSDVGKFDASTSILKKADGRAIEFMHDNGEIEAEVWRVDNEIDPAGALFFKPRLFHCQIRSNGIFRCEEIAGFEQDDMYPDDFIALDGGDEYLRTDPNDRSEETTRLIQVPQGSEPKNFKRLFPAWNNKVL